MNLTFKRRDNTPVSAELPIKFSVGPYSWHAIGGPERAEIQATGLREDLYELLEWARYTVEITNDVGTKVWWGYISKVEITDGPILAYVDVDQMANRIAVAYTTVAAGEQTTGERGTTTWAEDEDSMAEFGRRELLDSQGGTTQIHAEARRDSLLARHRNPTGRVEYNWKGQDELAAKLTCVGWWYTLEWLYANVPPTLAFAYDTLGGQGAFLGEGTRDALGQTFESGPSGWNLQAVELYCRKTGDPGDNLRVSIWSNPDDQSPGTPLGSATLAGADLATTTAWMRFTFDEAIALSPNASYFLVLDRTGGTDAVNYYAVRLNEAQSYAGGILREKVGSTWQAGPAADLPFRLYTNDIIETSQQVRSLLRQFGQFFRSVRVDIDSGIATESYRNGDSDAMYEVEELLETGTANNRRMLATVDPGRNVLVDEEPTPGAGDYGLLRSGQFITAQGALVEPSTCPVGFWARMRDVLPGNVDLVQLSGLGQFFVERAEYDPTTGKLKFDPLGEDITDIGTQKG